jgi:hypothetical protein
MHSAKNGANSAGEFFRRDVDMCVNEQEFEELIAALDRSLALFGEKPAEPGFDLEVYEELRRVRETLIRARRDMRDTNIKRDSRSPLGSA